MGDCCTGAGGLHSSYSRVKEGRVGIREWKTTRRRRSRSGGSGYPGLAGFLRKTGQGGWASPESRWKMRNLFRCQGWGILAGLLLKPMLPGVHRWTQEKVQGPD